MSSALPHGRCYTHHNRASSRMVISTTTGSQWLLHFLVFTIVFTLSAAVTDIQFQMQEEEPSDTLVGNIKTVWNIAADHSDDVQFVLDPAKSSDTSRDLFKIQANSGELRTAQVIDRDSICSFLNSCTLILGIGIVSSSRYESLSVSIEIIDINDNRPTFPLQTDNVGIPESTDTNTLFPLSEAIDFDSGRNGNLSYHLRPESNQFRIVTETNVDGSTDVQLKVLEPLDREIQDSYSFFLDASDQGVPNLSSSMLINITIVDINDNVATFTQAEYEFSVAEDISIGSVVATVQADDPDQGPNGRVIYEFSSRTQALFGDTFTINPNGEITLSKGLDFESITSYELTVSARDSAPNARNSFAKVTINVIDVNDFAPQITITTRPNSAQAEVTENAPVDTFIAHVSVIDRDAGVSGQVSCSLDNRRFLLQNEGEPTQFKLVTAFRFDRETVSSDRVTITCRDQGSPALTSQQLVEISIKDENDNDPRFDKALYSIVLQENNAAGIYVATVTARDPDHGVNSKIEYKIKEIDAGNMFEISENGMIITLQALDHERLQTIVFHVTAQDGGNPVRSAETAVQIQLIDMNDSPPIFDPQSFEFEVKENQSAGTDIGHLVATDADSSPNDIIHYGFQSDEFTLRVLFDLDKNSGHIKTRQPFDRETTDSYEFVVVAYNPDLPMLNSTARVNILIKDVNDNPPMFVFPSSENHTVFVGSDLRSGALITHAQALDRDAGENAWLSYYIESGNENGYFSIDENSGAVSVVKDLSRSSTKDYNISILVRDHGTSPLNSTETLIIRATGALAQKSEKEKFSSNMIILVSLVSISGILVILLLVAILWIVFKSRYRKSKKANYRERNSSRENLGPKVEIIDRLHSHTTGVDLNSSFKDQHFYDLHQKPGGREGPLHSHNSADSGFDEHHDGTGAQHGRHVSFKVKDTIEEQSELSNSEPQLYNEFSQVYDTSSTSSEEGSNTDSGCVLSEGLPDQHESQPAVPQRTYPKPQLVHSLSTPTPTQPQQQPPSTSHSRSNSESARDKKNARQKIVPENSAIKLRYVVDDNWPDLCASVDVDECGAALKNGNNVARNFSDCNSIMRYKVRHPSSQRCASEITDNSSSTSGSYFLTTDEHGTTAC